MNNTAIGVAAALLLGGGALYGGYQVIEGRDDGGARADAESTADARSDRDERLAADDADGRLPSPDRAGMDFAVGADGDEVRSARREADLEAAREAERLAMLGTDELDIRRAPGDPVRAEGDGAAEGETEAGRARGLRDAAPDADADADPALASSGTTDTDVDRLLADIAAREAEAGRTGDGTVAGGQRFAANDTSTAPGRRLVDKPDRGGFTAGRLIDKPDEGGFVASADTQRFDPCEKADGTLYVGPGTALNPFAETDPCLPQSTAQGYEVASLEAAPAPPVVDVAQAQQLVPVDVSRPFLAAPPPIGTGSDYAG